MFYSQLLTAYKLFDFFDQSICSQLVNNYEQPQNPRFGHQMHIFEYKFLRNLLIDFLFAEFAYLFQIFSIQLII